MNEGFKSAPHLSIKYLKRQMRNNSVLQSCWIIFSIRPFLAVYLNYNHLLYTVMSVILTKQLYWATHESMRDVLTVLILNM